jgi:hypothetical protein
MRAAMRQLLHDTLRSLRDSVRDLAPIVLVVAFFQIFVVRAPLPDLGGLVAGALFVRGLEMGLFPLGETMAYGFARRGSVAWLLLFAFALGFGTTIAEPALIAIADEAAKVAAQDGAIVASDVARTSYAYGLRLTVALSVGAAVVLGVVRILKGWPLHWFIMAGYVGVVVMTTFAPAEIIGIAYDSGGVTTSTVTVPLVTALGIGLAQSIRGRNPLLDGFGIIAFASLTPMIFVMGYGMVIR